MQIDKTELYKLYMAWVEEVSEACDWKTHFTPKEIVYAISRILEEHPELILNN